MISPFVEIRDVAERLVAEPVLLQRADAELGVERSVEPLGEVEVLGVGPDLIAEDEDRELVHSGPDPLERLRVADALEVDRAHLRDEVRVKSAECQGHARASRIRA